MTEFVVKIVAKPSVSDEVLRLLLARAFNTSPDKFEQMLEHFPPVIVARKPSEAEAQGMANKFESLGFQVEVIERSVTVNNPAPKTEPMAVAPSPRVPSPPPVEPPQRARKNATLALGRKPATMDNLGEGVLALPSKRSIRWPTLPGLTLSRTLGDKPAADKAPARSAGNRPTLVSSQESGPAIARPQSLPTQVVEPDRIDTLVERTPRRLSLQSRVFLAGALPMLLSIILVGMILQQAVPPMLNNLLQRTAQTSAITLASAAQPLLQGDSGANFEQLFKDSQPGLKAQGIRFALLTDTLGNPAKGWSDGEAGPSNLSPEIRQTLRAEAQQLSGRKSPAVSQVVVLADQTLAIAAAPVISQGAMVGTMVVGMEALGFAEGFQEVLRNVLLAGLLPVFLAMLAALMVTRAMARVIMQLTRAVDRIGMGDLDTEIGVRTGDELELLSHAMDRMRLGLRKHIDRQLRR